MKKAIYINEITRVAALALRFEQRYVPATIEECK
jgi:hypothetical protein